MYLPQLQSFRASALYAASAVAVVGVLVWASAKGSLSPTWLGLGALAAWVAWRLMKRSWRQGKARARGLSVEKQAVTKLTVEAEAFGWAVKRPLVLIPGIGNTDALIEAGFGRDAVVEIKSFQSFVNAGVMHRANGASGDRTRKQVKAQVQATNRKALPVVWCPTGPNFADVTRDGVVVVNGSARFLVLKLNQLWCAR